MERTDSILARVVAQLTADNATELLAYVACPQCGVKGSYITFSEPNNNGIGLRCQACGERHPFRAQKVMWLRQGAPERSNDLKKVMAERGAYCWLCGCSHELLRSHGIGMHVHHSQSFAEHGDRVEKIPLCALCHEIASAVQRHHGHLLTREG